MEEQQGVLQQVVVENKNHFNQLTPAELERLAFIAEECAEVIHVVGKIMRHGYESTHPSKPELGTNRQRLSEELVDVLASIQLLDAEGDLITLPNTAINDAIDRKIKYAHHQPL
jgi:NTP pyrophosphatase (non-canonical NTP hydrolase)